MMDKEKELRNLVKQLRRQATNAYKKTGAEHTFFEGMNKGMYLAYEEAASRILEIIK